MNGKRTMLMALAATVLVAALFALAACSQPAQSSKSEERPEANEVTVQASSEDEPFYVLVVGNDTRTGTAGISEAVYADGNARSDTMMLARVDPTTYLITLVSIPRDTRDVLADGSACKINEHYNVGGIQETLSAVESLTGVRPKYYFDTTFVGFQDLVNKLEGIHMYVPFDQSMTDVVSGKRISYSAGEQDLDGAQALIYARERHKYENMGLTNQEAYRQSADRKILETIVMKVLSNASTAQAVTELLYGCVDTNWNLDDLKAFVADFAEHVDEVTFLSGTGPYEGGIDSETNLWMAYRDEATWHEIIDVVDRGGDPNTVLVAPSVAE